MIIGRTSEIQILRGALEDTQSHFIAVYGRRRIGKTFLIRETYENRFTFQHAGISDGSLQEQLFAFDASLKDAGLEPGKPSRNWAEGFEKLKDLIRQSTENRKIIFIDELSWMDTPRSNMLRALEHFWNGWASARKDIILIVCTSATSWMLSKVIHHKGGLYNRLTEQIHLKPFRLAVCEEYVRSRKLALNREQILQYYMIFGGVPYYWSFLRRGLSLTQNIDRILFAEDAPLGDEFQYLYAAIFKHPEDYLRIVETLARRKEGMTREKIISHAGLTNSGDLTKKLQELESCGFIRKYTAFGKKAKDAVYQLIDHFTLFYYHFLIDQPTDEHFWGNQLNTPAVNTWMGLAFEQVCLQHVRQIKEKLGIAGVLTDVNAWRCTADPEKGLFGSQIDLLIARKDQVINLCEMKYSGTEYTITSAAARSIRHKISDLRTGTGTKYAIHPTLVTTFGLVDNTHADLIQSVVTMEDLFV
ncbi:MAG: ATP-binding protein [Firmicutes bacterium]|nr:ATP-binding protein [Bacillota bacterium]